MAEPDHIIVKPIPNLSKDGLGAAFPFFYIEPKKYESVLRKYFPEEKGPITNIDPIGNSPVIVGKVSILVFVWFTIAATAILVLPCLDLFVDCLGFSQKNCSDLDECVIGNEERS